MWRLSFRVSSHASVAGVANETLACTQDAAVRVSCPRRLEPAYARRGTAYRGVIDLAVLETRKRERYFMGRLQARVLPRVHPTVTRGPRLALRG